MNNYLIWYYLAIINLLSGILFSYDKQAARKNRRRIPETTLHTFELVGGAFANIMLMYTLRHKNRKFSYYWVTWVVMIGWVVILTQGKNLFSYYL
ncbi:MAG: DUF1294 domain-containing protein [Paludibacter sp.]